MRRMLGLAMAALTSCALPIPHPVEPGRVDAALAGSATFLDQGWSDADRKRFTTTPQGSYLMPMAWFIGLWQVDKDEPFAGDQLRRYGYLPTEQ